MPIPNRALELRLGDRVRTVARWPGLRVGTGRIIEIHPGPPHRYMVEFQDGSRFTYVGFNLRRVEEDPRRLSA